MKLSFRSPVTLSLGLILFHTADGTAQADPASGEHPLRNLAFLEGFWAGDIDGTIGPATGRREYRFIMRDRFLLMMHDRDPDPQERAPQDDAYEEWGIFSFDTERRLIVLREFLVEGLVNTYVCEIGAEPKRLTCENEASEGGAGLTLRLRYDLGDLDNFTETFEIFGSDGGLQVRMEGQWRRTSERG